MINSIIIRPSSSLSSAVVEIRFSDMIESPDAYHFSLERAESSVGPWYTVSSDRVGAYMTDNTISGSIRPGQPLFYRVTMRDSNGSIAAQAMNHLNIGDRDRFALTIERNYQRYLDSEGYNEYLLIKRSKSSGYCICFDDVRMESSNPRCPICHGTGNVDGYIGVAVIKVSVLNPMSNEALIKEMFGEITLDTTGARAWTTGQYKVDTEDILVNLFTNEAYEVSSVSYSKRHNYIVRHALTMSRLKAGHPVYEANEITAKIENARQVLETTYNTSYGPPYNLIGQSGGE